MNFVSYSYVVLLAATLFLFFVTPAKMRFYVLLVASYVFYSFWSIPFLILLLVTTSLDYYASTLIAKANKQWHKQLALSAALGSNLLVLAAFKYFNFLSLNLNLASDLFHWSIPKIPHSDLIMPLGISYFTFEAISYVVDVYRGRPRAKNLLEYNFYIMYFPHLVAGPIVRFDELRRQYCAPISLPSEERIQNGIELLVTGFLFKIFIADALSALVSKVFENPSEFSALSCMTVAIQFCAALYFDFLGYTNIARGTSLLFNIELPKNFNHPFNIGNIASFWQRWQMTLSRWLHDYLYVPLGGNSRRLEKRVTVAFTTLLVAGIWHGAGWNFVAMGAVFGSLVAVYHVYRAARKKLLGKFDKAVTSNPIYSLVASMVTNWGVFIAAVFFRESNMSYALQIVQKMNRFDLIGPQLLDAWRSHNYLLIAAPILTLALMTVGPIVEQTYKQLSFKFPYWMKLPAATAALLACWIMSTEGSQTFIYFQF